jgi:hypothetical protein
MNKINVPEKEGIKNKEDLRYIVTSPNNQNLVEGWYNDAKGNAFQITEITTNQFQPSPVKDSADDLTIDAGEDAEKWDDPKRVTSLLFLEFVCEKFVQVAQNGWRGKGFEKDLRERTYTSHELYEIFKNQTT